MVNTKTPLTQEEKDQQIQEAQTQKENRFWEGLFNRELPVDANEAYYTILMEQWKTASEQTNHIADQRNNINNFYMSLMSLLIGGILLSDKFLPADPIPRTATLVLITILGVLCCCNWKHQVETCKKINKQKFQIIGRLERELPARVISFERKVPLKPIRLTPQELAQLLPEEYAGEEAPEESLPKKKWMNLSDHDILLIRVFRAAIVTIAGVLIVDTWGLVEIICSLFQA